MRKKIIAGNWKMFKDLVEANDFFKQLIEKLPDTEAEVMIAPSFTNLWHSFQITRDYPIEIIAQNMHEENLGAYTGEVSAEMLKSVGVQRVILGHSERRMFFGECDEQLNLKVECAVNNEMNFIFCVGEEMEDRNSNNHFKVIKRQLDIGLFEMYHEDWKHAVIAYEPVWAIGTGETARPEQAQEMHHFIRKTIADVYGNEIAENVSILYGGSVKPDNAKQLFQQPDIDGALVGGASLKVSSFIKIIQAI